MMQTRRGTVLSVALLSTALATPGPGFAQTAAPRAAAPPAATAEPLTARLLREVGAGAAVAIVPGKQGLRAISSDGARQRVLIPGEVPWALVDNRGQAVWFKKGDGAALWLLDLTRPEPAAEIVVTGVKDFDIALAYPGTGGTERLRSRALGYDGGIEIQVADRPSLKKMTGVYGEIFLDQERQRMRVFQKSCRLTPAGRALLPQLARRGQGRRLALAPPPAKTLPRVESVPRGPCEDADVCGQAEELPGTPLWRVAVAYSCGDACFTTHQLYDPRTRQFVPGHDPSRRSPTPLKTEQQPDLEEIYVAPDGSALLVRGHILRLGGKSVATGEGLGGWLGGAWHVQ